MNGRASDLHRADAEARLAAQRVFDRPVVLEAGAGTGKTTALVARLVCWCLGPGWDLAAHGATLSPTAEAWRARAPHGSASSHPDRIAARVLEGVVAITFTEAAAAEMAARVAAAFAALARGNEAAGVDAASLPEAADLRQERARALLHGVDRLRVSTIHAFCSRLLAANPAEAGFHPSFAVDADETRVDEIVRAAVAARFRGDAAGKEADDLVTLAAAGIDPDRIARALGALVRQGVPDAALAADPFARDRVAALAAALADRVTALAAAIGDRFAGLKRAKNAIALADGLNALHAPLTALQPIRHCEEPGPPPAGRVTKQSPSSGADCFVASPEARLLAVTAGRERAQSPTLVDLKALVATHLPDNLLKHLQGWAAGTLGREEAAAIGDAAGALVARAADLAPVIAAVGRCDEVVLGAARRALAPLLAEVRSTMRTAGVVVYADLLGGCRGLLVEHPEVAARERRAIDLLVVDEFQDTDALQCEIVAALALEGAPETRPNLFLVGDPKQSIYGWRNADLAAYEAFVDRVVAAGGERHALSVNFRSVPAVLAEVERCIAPVMTYERGLQPPFEPLIACEEKQADAGFQRSGRSPVEHWIIADPPQVGDADGAAGGGTSGDEPTGATEVEARAIANDIAELHEGEGLAWSDVAILMRATTDLPVYLQALRDAGVPYAVERDRTFYRRREILEAAALLRAVLDPTDHIALLAWLRSASVGVPDAALLPLWSRRFPDLMTELSAPDDDALMRVREVIAAAAAATPEVPGIERIAGWEYSLAAAVGALAAARHAYANRPAAEFVEVLRTATLIEATESARVLGVYRVANLDRFFRALLGAMEESGSHPQAVLRALRRALREQPEAEEGRPRDAALDAVRVMTIHKAKGLDFAHVYLVQAARRARGDLPEVAAAELVDGAWEVSLFGMPSPGWWRAAARTRRVADAELVRTLYVAMTRARVRLVISGEWPRFPADKLGVRPSHLKLLTRRLGGVPDVAALAAAVKGDRAVRADHGGAAWVVPPAAAPAERRGSGAAVVAGLAGVDEVAAQARALDRLGDAAAAHMARPWSAPASAEAHRLFDETEDGDEQRPQRRRRDGGRDLATAAGTLVHRFLEGLDLEGDLGAQLAAAPAGLAALAPALDAEGADPVAAVERAAAVVARLASSSLVARLAAIAPNVVARELPVLLPPAPFHSPAFGRTSERSPSAGGERGETGGAGSKSGCAPGASGSFTAASAGASACVQDDSAGSVPQAVAFIAGAIDLVYRDTSTGELVIADYKTDDIASDVDLAEKAAAYRSQGAVYRRALAEALALAKPPRFELWFLSAARIVPVDP